jgi:hypothetical protein
MYSCTHDILLRTFVGVSPRRSPNVRRSSSIFFGVRRPSQHFFRRFAERSPNMNAEHEPKIWRMKCCEDRRTPTKID